MIGRSLAPQCRRVHRGTRTSLNLRKWNTDEGKKPDHVLGVGKHQVRTHFVQCVSEDIIDVDNVDDTLVGKERGES
jgi:hypothetical protein